MYAPLQHQILLDPTVVLQTMESQKHYRRQQIPSYFSILLFATYVVHNM